MDEALQIRKELILDVVNNSEISSIRQIVIEILRTLQSEDASARDLKEIIERDPTLCAKLLKRANSSFYGFPRTIGDIQEAIITIGFDTVKELALHQKVCELFTQRENTAGYSRRGLWKHCSAVAVFCKLICRREFCERGEDAFIAGLLHDLGIIVEDQFFQQGFRLALDRVRSQGVNLWLAERDFLGFDHAEVGRIIAEDWQFPEELVLAIGSHHQPLEGPVHRLAMTVYLAECACQSEQMGFPDAPYRDERLFRDCLKRFGLREKAVELILEETVAEIRKMEETGWL